MRLAVGPSHRRWVVMSIVTLALSAFLGSFPVPLARAADGLWTQNPPPDWKLGATAVYDRTHHRMILFGGTNGLQQRNDVWVLELSYPNRWRRLVPTGTPPAARQLHNAVYDPIQDRMIVFGGLTPDANNATVYNDVWALEQLGGTPHWTQITPTGTPPLARFGSVAAFDTKRNRVVVYGGIPLGGPPIGDLWSLNLSGTPTWVQIAPTTFIGPRGFASAVIDSVRDRMVVMGGTVDGASSLTDAWAYDLNPGGAWTEITTLGTPPAAYGHASAYDPLHDQMIVFGGVDAAAHTINLGAWRLRFNLATPTWSRVSLTGTLPPTVYYASAIYDPIADAFRVFGGWGNHPSTVSQQVYTLWLHPSPNWGTPLPSNAPPPTGRQGAAVAYDAANRRMIVFGGQRQWSPVGLEWLNDVWVLDLTTVPPTWTELAPDGSPPEGRSFASLVYDPSGNRVILYGGTNGNSFPATVQALSLGGTPTWSELTPAGTPPAARAQHGAIYDPVRDRMVLFGGSNGSYLGDAWALSLSGSPTWTQLTPAGTPPSRRLGMSVVLDSARDRMLMFGGLSDIGTNLNRDVWALNLAGGTAWDSIEVAFGPLGRHSQLAAYDPARDRLLVFGGNSSPAGNPIMSDDTWSLSLAGSPAWTQLQPAVSPDPDAYACGVFDVAGDRLVKYGGGGGHNGLWFYQPSAALAAPPPIPVAGGDVQLRAAPNPSRGTFDLSFAMPVAGRAQVGIYDLTGRRVARLVDGLLPAGPHASRWDGRIGDRAAPPGVYFARFEHPGGVATMRLLLIR